MSPPKNHPWRQYFSEDTREGTPGNLSREERRRDFNRRVVKQQQKPIGGRLHGVTDIECSCRTPEGDDECPVHGERF